MIEVRRVFKNFINQDKEIVALNDISFSIGNQEIVGIIGYSGAGKSTLLRLLNGLAVPSSGEVLVDGKNPQKLKGKEMRLFRQQFGMVFQHFHLLWSRTVYKNIQLALEIARVPKSLHKQRVEELLQLVGLSHLAQQYPSTLSGGEKQRVGIARALANHPRYLLCDEATSALDPENTRSILGLLQNIRQELGVTIVFITHQMDVVQSIADRVIVMQDGRIVEENTLLSILVDPHHEVTKKFIKSIITSGDVPFTPTQKIYRLSYIESVTTRPLISEMIRMYQVEVNILQGKINRIGSSIFGTLFVTIEGNKKEDAIRYLENEGVKVVNENDSMG